MKEDLEMHERDYEDENEFTEETLQTGLVALIPRRCAGRISGCRPMKRPG